MNHVIHVLTIEDNCLRMLYRTAVLRNASHKGLLKIVLPWADSRRGCETTADYYSVPARGLVKDAQPFGSCEMLTICASPLVAPR